VPTFRQLEIFIEAALDCNFRKTADRLGISQPAISSQIVRLEQEFGHLLFDRRRGTTPQLTPGGIALLGQAQATLDCARGFSSLGTGDRPSAVIELKVCVRHYMLERTIRPRLSGFLDRHPQFSIEFVVIDSTTTILEALRNGQCSMGIFRGRLPDLGPSFEIEVLTRTPCFIFAHPRLAEEAREQKMAISDLPFVLPREGAESLPPLLSAMAGVGIYPHNVVARSQFADTLAEWVLSGRGVSPLLRSHMRGTVEAGKSIIIGPPLGEWCTMIVYDRDALGPEYTPVLDFFRSILD